MVKKLCIKDFKLDGLPFCKGTIYDVEYNPVDGRIYIYNVWGYTTISKYLLDKNFL